MKTHLSAGLGLTLALTLALAACSPAKKQPPQKQPAKTAPAATSDRPEFSEGFDPAQKALMTGKAYLEENRLKPGVVTTASGLQYKVLKSGPEDGAHPYPGQFVCVNYRGAFIGGKEFDSSYARGVPAVFPSDRLIKGWVEALSLMRPGDEWMLYVPSALAYGASGTMGGPIGPNQTLVFKINLIRLMNLTPEQYQSTYGANPALDCSKAP